MSENLRVAKAAGIVGVAALLSRILGFARDAVIAGFFGTSLGSDAFFAAFRIPNLFRRLFAEGSLSIAFIPVFTEHLEEKGRAEAFCMARSAIRFFFVVLVIAVLTGVLFSPLIMQVIAPGFACSPEKLALSITLCRIMLPYIVFIGIVAVFMGILNVLGHFTGPALAPLVLNIAIICSIFLVCPLMSVPVYGLAIGIVAGGFLQFVLQIPFLIKNGFYLWQKAPFFHPGLKKITSGAIPAVFGASAYQVNILAGTLLASLLDEGSISYLYFADRLVQFPLGIFAVAVSTAVLPSLSRQAVAGDYDSLRETFAYSARLVFFIMIPSTVGLMVLREPIVTLLFQRGAFNPVSTRLTSDALLYFCVGLWAFSSLRIVVSVFYALGDTRTPVKAAVFSIIANLLSGIILMRSLGHCGIALSTSIASILNLVILVYALRTRLGGTKWKNIVKSACKSLVNSVIMGVIVRFLQVCFHTLFYRS